MDIFHSDIEQSICLQVDRYVELETGEGLRTIRVFKDASFPFILQQVHMPDLSLGKIPWHWHDEIEVIYAFSQTIEVRTDKSSYTLTKGDACFINTDVLHSVVSADPEATFLYFRFHPYLLFPKSNSRTAGLYHQPITHNPALESLFFDHTVETHKNIISAIEDMIRVYAKREICYELKITGTLNHMWAYLYEIVQSNLSASHTKDNSMDSQRIKEAISFIAKNYASPLTLQDIADVIHVSRNECCRCFQRAVGYSPIEYLMHYRVLESTKKMKNKEAAAESVSALAASCGFNNTSYFNKLFKRYTNMTPLEYKKRFCQ